MLEYLFDGFTNTYRVWVKGWPGDTFKVMTPEVFKQLEELVHLFPGLLTLTECDDD